LIIINRYNGRFVQKTVRSAAQNALVKNMSLAWMAGKRYPKGLTWRLKRGICRSCPGGIKPKKTFWRGCLWCCVPTVGGRRLTANCLFGNQSVFAEKMATTGRRRRKDERKEEKGKKKKRKKHVSADTRLLVPLAAPERCVSSTPSLQ